jgi:hypothetical protein
MKYTSKIILPATLLTAAIVLAGCARTDSEDKPSEAAARYPEKSLEVAYNPDKMALFGDLHVHTQYSFDAFAFGARATPDDAYRYAKGEPLKHPGGSNMQLDRPLDFQAITDHGVYLGIVPAMMNKKSRIAGHPLAQQLQNTTSPEERINIFYDIIRKMVTNYSELADAETMSDAWQDTIESADRHYQPGKFTTFIAYEYSAAPESQTMHRNVIFRSRRAPSTLFTASDSQNPEDLWNWMDSLRDDGIDALAIPHNSNASNGQMFKLVDWASNPLDIDYATQRMRNEPLIEITQVKGTSETHPTLSPADPWADFEIMNTLVGADKPSKPSGSYAREALLNGLAMETSGQGNPFKFGFIGSSDTHVGAGPFSEDDYWGKSGLINATGKQRGSVPTDVSADGAPQYEDNTFSRWGASGLAAVWAESNTRDSIFNALRNKETFATSGPRIQLRFFAGHNFPSNMLTRSDPIKTAYTLGVPMGSNVTAQDLPPTCLAWAVRDANSKPLQRLQVIKGWIDDRGQPQERIFDVACAPGLTVDAASGHCIDDASSVNLTDCSIDTDTGSSELKSMWTDPSFELGQDAFYYLRALEVPSCRWSTWDSVRAGTPRNPALPPTIQERAWSSPIWVKSK